jgi:hypothetical protein
LLPFKVFRIEASGILEGTAIDLLENALIDVLVLSVRWFSERGTLDLKGVSKGSLLSIVGGVDFWLFRRAKRAVHIS